MNTGVLIELLARANFSRVLIRAEYPSGALTIESNTRGDILEHLVVTRVTAVGEISRKQRLFQLFLLARFLRPMQQPVSVERVVNAAPLVHVENEAQRGATVAEHVLVPGPLLGARAVLSGDMLTDIFPLGAHLG